MLLNTIITLLPLLAFSTATTIQSRQAAPVQCKTCSPLPLTDPQCHITTSCVVVPDNLHTGSGQPPNYCACRAGYKATDVGADPSAQWRLPWGAQEGRVFVRPGVICDTLCDKWQLGAEGCKEVPEYRNCL